MPEISIEFNPQQIADIESRLEGIKDGVPKACAGAINDTCRNVRTNISADIRDKINIKKKDLDKHILLGQRATPTNLSSGVRLEKTDRLKLGYFGAKQTSQGVSYAIQTDGGRKQIAHAFGPDIDRLGHQVFLRIGRFVVPQHGRYAGRIVKRGPHKGQLLMREVIRGPKRGPSAWGVFVMSGMLEPTVDEANEMLEKNMERRTKFLVLKANGN